MSARAPSAMRTTSAATTSASRVARARTVERARSGGVNGKTDGTRAGGSTRTRARAKDSGEAGDRRRASGREDVYGAISSLASTSARASESRARTRRGGRARPRAIDEPTRLSDGTEEQERTNGELLFEDGVNGESDVVFAEGTVYKKKLEGPSSEELWYAGYIRELEGSLSADEEEEEEADEVEIGPKAKRNPGREGIRGIIYYAMHRLPGMTRSPLPTVVQNPVDNLSVWALATCGFLWTASTCMVFSLLPVFLQTEFGFSNTRIGAVEGFALFVSNFSRVFSGVLSDILKSRVKVIAVGSVMTAAMKVTLASAVSVQQVVIGKLLDRFGKGIRAAPTDALIADLSPRPKRSATYGLHQSMTTLGGVVGSLVAMTTMNATSNNFRATFTLASIPSIIAIFILMKAVRKPKRMMSKPKYKPLMLPGRGRALPSWKRHTRGPLAMPHLRSRWRRAACTSNVREIVWHRGQKTWKTVRDWLWQMKSRSKMVSPFLDQIMEGFEDSKDVLGNEGTVRIVKASKRKSRWLRRADGGEMTQDDLRTRALIWADDPWAEAQQQGGPRSKPNASSFMWGEWNWSLTEVAQLPWAFWRALLVFSILKVARFSEAFVTLHAKAVGMQVAYLPVLMFATNIMQSALTYPLGIYADEADQQGYDGRKNMLLGGFALMVVADVILIMANVPWMVFAGYLVVGIHMSMTQGNMKAVLSATMPPNVRGTGFAIAAMSQGLSLGFGNYMAGYLCDQLGSAGAFYGGCVFALLALAVCWLLL